MMAQSEKRETVPIFAFKRVKKGMQPVVVLRHSAISPGGSSVLLGCGDGMDGAHPGSGRESGQPIVHRGHSATIFQDVLLADILDRNKPVSRFQHVPKNGQSQSDSLARVPQEAVPELGIVGLGGVKPVVEKLIVAGIAAEFTAGGNGMEIGMSHVAEIRFSKQRAPRQKALGRLGRSQWSPRWS